MKTPDNWRELVCAEALTWEGTPYVPHARVKGVGTDCGGFLYENYNPYFDLAPFPNDYAADWALHSKRELYLDFIVDMSHPVAKAEVGDFTLFHMGGKYAHAAILLPDDQYIHAWGRLREGRVTRSSLRVMQWLAKQSKMPMKHFSPNPRA